MVDLVDRIANLSPDKRALLRKRLAENREGRDSSFSEPIAVVGMGCRFPGGANSTESFWRLLVDGKDAIAEVPPERRASCGWDRVVNDLSPVRWGGFVSGVDLFDAAFFGISPREASRMDPQQRMMLEVAWEALEIAGLPPSGLAGSRTGVFAGIHSQSSDYYWMQIADLDAIEPYASTGTAHSIVANRLSYFLDLRGPSLTVDTACSSSLVAVHLACRSLQIGECDLALAGGVNLVLSPETSIAYSKLQFLSPDGRCKTFDASANGFVRSEGCGLVVLKRLTDALDSNDPILALVRGSAVNQDGASNGLTAPNGLAQQAVVREAIERAEIDPSSISFVETHGTGTELGDPIEVEALAAVLGPRQPNEPRCRLGAVKSNIGHLESAAGIAGFIKTVLCLKHRFIPPNIHFRALNPKIALEATPFEIPAEGCDWNASPAAPRRAGVSSFGFGGTNAHIVLQEAPSFEKTSETRADEKTIRAEILPLSARSEESLRALAQSYREFLADISNRSGAQTEVLSDIAYTASVRRPHHARRVAFAGRSLSEWIEGIDAFLSLSKTETSSIRRKSGLAFVYSGQGPQWYAMGRELMNEEPVFLRSLEACDAAFRPLAGWSLLEELRADESRSRMNETSVAQPALFALQVALTDLWRSWGVAPDAVVGHSVGEVAAAWAAGALSLEDVIRVIYHRSVLMSSPEGVGAMAAVGLSREEAERSVSNSGGRVVVAAVNSPELVTLSGETAALDEILREFDAHGVFNRKIRVSHAFHSPLMDSCRAQLVPVLEGLRARKPTIPIASAVEGNWSEDFGPEYWGRNVRESVLFAQAIDRIVNRGIARFLEIGPHPVLCASISDCLTHLETKGIALASLRRGRPERATMLGALGDLYSDGYDVEWARLTSGRRVFIDLPTYAWHHERHWLPASHGEAEPKARDSEKIDTRPKASEKDIAEDGIRRRLTEATPEERSRIVLNWTMNLVKRPLGLGPGAPLDVDVRLAEVGLDSLMAVEIRSRLRSELEVDLTLAEILGDTTVRRLAEMVSMRFVPRTDSVVSSAKQDLTSNEAQSLLSNIDRLSDEQVNRILERLSSSKRNDE